MTTIKKEATMKKMCILFYSLYPRLKKQNMYLRKNTKWRHNVLHRRALFTQQRSI